MLRASDSRDCVHVNSDIAHSFESRDGTGDATRSARLVVAGELLAAITHDLRQPLTAIEMNVAAALRRLEFAPPDESPAQEAERRRGIGDALRDALAEQRRMREALQVFQDLAARREPAFGPVDLSDSVREVVRLVASDAAARQVRIDVSAPADVPRILADPALVRQALLNIVLDALEATSESAHENGPVSVSVMSRDPESVDVVVTHFGECADSTGGWGLALARSVTQAHDGSLRVSGDPEEGITVTTRWPLHAPRYPQPRENRLFDD
jgi:signal transduction histidine kinase